MNNQPILDLKLVQATYNYLLKRPYGEVVDLIGAWNEVLKPFLQPNPEVKVENKEQNEKDKKTK